MAERLSYSRETRLKVQRLYVGKGMSPREISAEVGISAQAVSNIVYRHGLAEVRRRNESRALARVEDRAVVEAEEFVASITPQAMEAAEHGFKLARSEDAKEFAMAMKGTQIAVMLARQGLGLDAKGGGANGGRGSTTAFVFCRFGDAGEKRAEPVDVKAESVSESQVLDFAEDDLRDSEGSPSEANSDAQSNDLQNFERSSASHNGTRKTETASR